MYETKEQEDGWIVFEEIEYKQKENEEGFVIIE